MAAQVMDLRQFSAWAARVNGEISRTSWKPCLDRVRLSLIQATKENFARGQTPDGAAWPPIKGLRARGGNKPLRDRGLLMASVTAQGPGHVSSLTDTELVFGTNLHYAATHQYGATILPKSAKALAIPLTPEAYRAQGPRNFPGKLALIWPKGRQSGWLQDEQGVRQFLLKKSVTIPPRPFLGIGEKLAKRIEDITVRWLQDKIGGVK